MTPPRVKMRAEIKMWVDGVRGNYLSDWETEIRCD